MKRLLLLFLFVGSFVLSSNAQLPSGSVAPDFTVTDINGNTHNLYTYLNAGKTVYLDFFATWCGPCWSYHQSHALEDLWTAHGPSGTNEAVVIAIEASSSTNVACLSGQAGCSSSTQGNWTAGVTYPIVNTDALSGANNYSQGVFPTIYMICPQDKKIWQAGQNTGTGLWGLRTNKCINGSIPMAVTLVNKQDVKCNNTNTGRVDIITIGGFSPYTYSWSNGTTMQDIVNVPAGTYTCTVTAADGTTVVSGPHVVASPPSPLTATGMVVQQPGCNGVLGTVEATPVGGWSFGYFYNWNNGATTKTVPNAPAGLYNCTVTDNNFCTKTFSVTANVANPPVVTAPNAANSPVITCANPSVQLAVATSSASNQFGYAWTPISGNIVSGANTANPTVNQGGAYQVVVTDQVSSCTSQAVAQVNTNTNAPVCSAPTLTQISCANPAVSVTATVFGGTQYQWVASNGGVINSGATSLTCVVGAPGTYTFTVTNATNGCTASAVTIVQGSGALPTVTAMASGSLTCAVQTVNLSASSTTAGVTYKWTGPGINTTNQNQQNPAVTAAGSYTVVVTAANGCSNSQSVTVVSNTSVPTVTVASSVPALGCQATSAQLSANVTPTANYTFAWSLNGQSIGSTSTITATQGGTYSVVVTNSGNGCSASSQLALTATPSLGVSILVGAQVLCNGGNNGSASASIIGGTQPISYLWNNGGTTSTISNLVAGPYSVVATDAQGCTASSMGSISQPTAIIASATSTAITTVGVNNGTATVTGSGGTGSFTYSWSNGQTTASITGLAPATYTVVITDANGCSKSATTTVQGINCALSATATATAVTAQGVNNGTVTATAAGGSGALTYNWSNGQTTATISGLAPGTYTVIVTDASGCTASATTTVQGVNCALTGSVTTTPVSCFGGTNGTATVTLANGTAPFAYTWSGSSSSNLGAGNYTVTATDAQGCAITLSFTISQPTDIVLPNAIVTNVQCANDNSGVIRLEGVTGGTTPYTVAWSNGGSGMNIGNLAAGTYTPIITDSKGCTKTGAAVIVATIDITAPTLACPASRTICSDAASAVSYANPTATDNCTVNPSGLVLNAGPASGQAFAVGVNTVSYTYTDGGGNTATCSFTITVGQPLVLSASTITNGVTGVSAGAVNVTVIGGTGPLTYSWKNAAGTVVGNTQNLTNITTSGAYTLQVTDANGCTKSFPSFQVNMTISANEPVWLQGVQLTPNPATTEVRISWSDLLDLEISILDMSGRTVHQMRVQNSNQVQIPVNEWPEGAYLVKIQSGNESGYRKLLVTGN
jgi:HYR domain/Secretion system C-terminal sorting domain/SprB repeat/AhpC/TSA family